jgi:transposase
MQALLECCCGIDIHRDILECCILKGQGEEPEVVRAQFKTTKPDLMSFIEWLNANSCPHIAMESTGVYWRPVYETIEANYCYQNLLVVNARHMRNLPGRKTDVKDAEWIATLLRHGLLEASFVPNRIIRTLREYSRTYKSDVQERTRLINRLEKFLQGHGFKLSSVLSNIIGQSGRNLLNKLADKGVITSEDVVEAVGNRIKRPIEEIQAAVCGELDLYQRKLLIHSLKQIDVKEESVKALLNDMKELANPYQTALAQMDSIPGIDQTAALAILAEIGGNPSENFKTSAHLCSWAGLAPSNDESAGKIKSRKTLHGNPYIKSILCQAAWASVKSRKSSFANWFWTHQAKLGRKKAIIAVARKILSLIYLLILNGEFYDPDIALSKTSCTLSTT